MPFGAFNQTGRHYLQVTEEARDFFPRSHAAPVPARALQDEPGSYVVISMGSGDEQTGARLARAYTATTLYNHPASQVARFMDGLELVGPGVVDARHWEPSGAARDGRCGLAHLDRCRTQGLNASREVIRAIGD